MKRIAANIFVLSFISCSLLWGVTERQEQIVNNICTSVAGGLEGCCTYKKIESLLPKYYNLDEWGDIDLDEFFQAELGISNDELEVVGSVRASSTLENDKILKVDKEGATYLIQLLDSGEVLNRSIENLNFSKLKLRNMKLPEIAAIGLHVNPDNHDLRECILVHKIASATSLQIAFEDWELSYNEKKREKSREYLMDFYFHLGKATGELHQVTSSRTSLESHFDYQKCETMNNVQEKLSCFHFSESFARKLNEKFAYYMNILRNTPQTYCAFLTDTGDWIYFFDANTGTVFVDDTSELEWSYYKGQPFVPVFIAYFKTLSEILPKNSKLELSPFKGAFDRGYVESGCSLPSAEEEEAYRFFDCLDSLIELPINKNFNWLWDQLHISG